MIRHDHGGCGYSGCDMVSRARRPSERRERKMEQREKQRIHQ